MEDQRTIAHSGGQLKAELASVRKNKNLAESEEPKIHMKKSLLAAFAAVACALLSPSAFAVTYSNVTLNGGYACELTGAGVYSSPFSRALLRFTANGAGGLSVGSIDIMNGSFGTTDGSPSGASPAFYFQNQYQLCKFTGSGAYSVTSVGKGGMTINWSPAASNASSPQNCTTGFKRNYDILVQSASTILILDRDVYSAANCDASTNPYACGESLAGTCNLQQ